MSSALSKVQVTAHSWSIDQVENSRFKCYLDEAQDNLIPHGLGKVPSLVLIFAPSANAVVWLSSSDQTNIDLMCSAELYRDGVGVRVMDWQIVPIKGSGGIDTKTDPKGVVKMGKWLRAENAHFYRDRPCRQNAMDMARCRLEYNDRAARFPDPTFWVLSNGELRLCRLWKSLCVVWSSLSVRAPASGGHTSTQLSRQPVNNTYQGKRRM